MPQITKAEDTQWKLAATKMPALPFGMDTVASREWNRIGRYLVALDRVAEIDKQALFAYCTMWSMFSRIMEEELSPLRARLVEDGPTCLIPHPLIAPLLRSAEVTLKKAGEFGLTARTRDLEGDHGNRKSSALKRLMGNQRKVATHRLVDRVTPMLPDWEPEDMLPPEWMNEVALAEFHALGSSLAALDLFTPLDVIPITIGCTLFEMYTRALDQMDCLTVPVYDKKGEEVAYKEHPLHKVLTDLHSILQYVWKDYGQTPRFRKVFDGEKKEDKKVVPLVFKGKFG